MSTSISLFDTLPPELIHLIHSFAIPVLPSHIQCDKCTTRFTLAHQDAVLCLRLVSPLWAQLVGCPTVYACRNITKIVQLTRTLAEIPERGQHVRKLVLHLREPSHGRRRTCILGLTLRALFELCPNLTEVVAGGVRMDHPDPTWDIWKGGARMLRVEALLDAASVCSQLESITLLGRNTAVGANFMLRSMHHWPKLRHLSLSHVLDAIPESPPPIAPELHAALEHLSISISHPFDHTIPARGTFFRLLSESNALSALTSLDIHTRITTLTFLPPILLDLLPQIQILKLRLSSCWLHHTGDSTTEAALADVLRRLTSVRYLELESIGAAFGKVEAILKALPPSVSSVVLLRSGGVLGLTAPLELQPPPRTMATINSLANETLIDIMEMLKESSPRPWHNDHSPKAGQYNALRAAALACSRWRDPAQRALFDEIYISAHYPLRTVRVLASPALPRHRTRSLTSVDMRITRGQRVGPGWLEVAEVCQGLQDFFLSGASQVSLRCLARPCFDGLKRLSIAVFTILDDPVDPQYHLPMHLSSLALCTNFNQPASTFLAATISSSIKSLECLNLRIGAQTSKLLSPALDVVGPRLRTFILGSSFSDLENDLDIFAIFTALESFSWSPTWCLPLEATDMENLGSILDALPSSATLSHLSIGTDDLSSLEHVIPLLQHPTLALLTTLEFPRFPTTPTAWLPPVAGELAQACETRGIRMSIGPS